MAKKRSFFILAGVLAVWLVAGMVRPASAQVSFAPAVNYPVGGVPHSVAVGDFNGDGKLDLVTANWESNNVSVLVGNGNGTFSAAMNFSVGQRPRYVVVADFNGDGKLDLAVANEITRNVSVLLGNGNGTFGAATYFPLGRSPEWLTVGDFNGDGKLDLATPNKQSDDVSVLLGNGNGTFGAATNFIAGQGPESVAVGDFNGNGKLDLVTAGRDDSNVSVLLGNGNGTFGAATNFSAWPAPFSVAVADFNGDGKLDLVTTHNTSTPGKVSILLGNGNGTFGTATEFPDSGEPFSVAVGDFNGDGKPDLATANAAGYTVNVLLGNGNGSFGEATWFRVGEYPRSVAVGDFNRDGKLDLVAANAASNHVSVLLNTTVQAPDTTPPVISCGRPDGFWHASDVSIACTAQDSNSGLADPADANFLLSTSVPSGTETSNAATGTRNVCDKRNNCATAGPITGNKVDKKAPSVSCLSADDQWHSANLGVACSASDGGSGVAPLSDASFSLLTNLPSGAESANATATTRNVCDAVNNCTSATVPGGVKVDRKGPTISIASPTATRYLPRQGVLASYSCADGGSGVALCVGPVPNRSTIDVAPPAGRKTFTVFAADKTGNVSSQTVNYELGIPGP